MNAPNTPPQSIHRSRIKPIARRVAPGILLVVVVGLAILSVNPVRTLASLRKVGDHPLYAMGYRGGYLFDLFLKVGIEESVSNSHTIWSAVYDMTSGDVQLAMDRDYDQIHTFALEMKNANTR
jgi:hypothetical protein